MKLISLLPAVLLAASVVSAGAEDAVKGPVLWQEAVSLHMEGGRLVDFASPALSTSAESESRALFLALVSGDKALFAKTFGWMRDNLAGGGTLFPMASLWGKRSDGSWGALETQGGLGAELWTVYALLEASRLWNEPEYGAAAREGLESLKKRFVEVRGIGTLIASDASAEGKVLFRPADFPPFVLKRLAAEDPAFKAAADASVRAVMLISPDGLIPDAARFDASGKTRPEKLPLSTEDAAAAYLWFAMTATTDPVWPLARERFQNALDLVSSRLGAPSAVDIAGLRYSEEVSASLAACFLPYLKDDRRAAYLRTAAGQDPLDKTRLADTLLRLIALGFDAREFRFDRDGRLLLKNGVK
jgi:endoglucanase